MKVRKSMFLILLFTTSITSIGQQIITDRPDQTESSSTVPKGSLQIESGLLLGFSDKELSSERQFIGPSSLFRYGLTNALEVRIVNQFESIKYKSNNQEISGISDLEIGVKLQLFQSEGTNAEIAFLSHLVLPTGSNDLTNDKLGTINKLAFSHELNKKLGLGYNLGYNYFGTGKGDLTYSLVLGFKINEKTGIYLEPYGELVDIREHLANFDSGFTYLLNDNFQLDFSFGTGINHTMNYISTGFSWNIRESSN